MLAAIGAEAVAAVRSMLDMVRTRRSATAAIALPYSAGVSGAAFFDLDRTLLAGASGEAFSAAMKAAGFTSRSLPGERFVYGLFNRIGETLPSMALARQGATLAKGRSRDALVAAGEAAADGLAAMVQPFAGPIFDQHRAAGRPDRAGHDDALRPRQAARRPARPRRRHRHPLRRQRRRHLRRHARRAVRVGRRQARGRAGPGPPSTTSTSARATPTPTASTTRRCSSAVGTPIVVNPDPRMVLMATARRWPILNLDVSPGVVKIPVLGIELQRLALQLSRPVADALRPLRHRRRRAHPGRRGGDPRRQPPQLLRLGGDVGGHRARAAAPCASSARRRSSTRRSSARWRRRWAASGSTGAPGRTSRCRPPPTRSPAARSWRSCRRARSRGARRSSTPSSRAAGAPPAWPR